MQLEVGMYVRTKYGIVKYENIPQISFTISSLVRKNEKIIDTLVVDDYISKSSHNIIDLIEVGDYVNGYQVTSKDQFLGFGNHDWYILDNEIKSIVTKEQFESISYKVGE